MDENLQNIEVPSVIGKENETKTEESQVAVSEVANDEKVDLEETAKQTQKAKMIKIFSIVVSVLLIVGAANSVWWIYMKLSGNGVNNTIMETPAPTQAPTPTAEPEIEILDWEIYSDEKSGLSFKYPQDWITQKLTGAIQDEIKVRPVSRTNGLEISIWLSSGFSEPSADPFTDASEVEVSGIKMKVLNKSTQNYFEEQYKYEGADSKYIIIFSLSGGTDYDYFRVLKRIISTVSLGEIENSAKTEIVDLPKEGWKRIDDSDFGAKFDVPETWTVNNNEQGYEIVNNVFRDMIFWKILEYKTSEKSIDTAISEIGAEYVPERVEERSYVTDWNYPATQIVVTTPAEKLYKSINIVVESADGEKFYVISNNGNDNQFFEEFWRSFRLK